MQTEPEDVLKVMYENKTRHHWIDERMLKKSVSMYGELERELNPLITPELTHCVCVSVCMYTGSLYHTVCIDTYPCFVPHLASRKTCGYKAYISKPVSKLGYLDCLSIHANNYYTVVDICI